MAAKQTVRIHLKVTEEERRLLSAAAALNGMSRNEFVIQAAMKRAASCEMPNAEG